MNVNLIADIIERVEMVVPPDPWSWVKPLTVGMLLAAVGGAAARLLYRAGKLPFLRRPPVVPEKTAFDELAAIRHLIDEERVRDYIREASRILRNYIEARFGLRAPRLSTEEFLYEAEQNDKLPGPQRERLPAFLFCCDRVKFALADLEVAQMETLHEAAVDFIVQTTAADQSPSDGFSKN